MTPEPYDPYAPRSSIVVNVEKLEEWISSRKTYQGWENACLSPASKRNTNRLLKRWKKRVQA